MLAKRYVILKKPLILIDTTSCERGIDYAVEYRINNKGLYEITTQNELIDYNWDIGRKYQKRSREIYLGEVLITSNNMETIINKIIRDNLGSAEFVKKSEYGECCILIREKTSKRDLDLNKSWLIRIKLRGTRGLKYEFKNDGSSWELI